MCKVFGSFETANYINLLVELYPGGELFFHINMNSTFDLQTARFYFAEILCGLKYMHDQNIIYRDMKPENILLDLDGHVRICDFGLCKKGYGPRDRSDSFCGSPEYMSPEMLLERGYTRMIDFYSLGALLFEMLTGLPPLFDEDRTKLYDKLLSEVPEIPQDLDEDARDLLEKILKKDPNERIGSE